MLDCSVNPGTRFCLFASMIASSTPSLVGTPSEASAPEIGRSAPILMMLPAAALLPDVAPAVPLDVLFELEPEPEQPANARMKTSRAAEAVRGAPMVRSIVLESPLAMKTDCRANARCGKPSNSEGMRDVTGLRELRGGSFSGR